MSAEKLNGIISAINDEWEPSEMQFAQSVAPSVVESKLRWMPKLRSNESLESSEDEEDVGKQRIGK